MRTELRTVFYCDGIHHQKRVEWGMNILKGRFSIWMCFRNLFTDSDSKKMAKLSYLEFKRRVATNNRFIFDKDVTSLVDITNGLTTRERILEAGGLYYRAQVEVIFALTIKKISMLMILKDLF